MFKFNFGEKHDEPSEAAATAKPGQKDKRQRAEAKEHFMSEAHMEHIGEDVVLVEDAKSDLIHLNGDEVEISLKRDGVHFDGASGGNSDLIPGVYEGGLKIWECSRDLVSYLERHWANHRPTSSRRMRVLELGCGAGLPGLKSLKLGAHVDFQDYNSEVIDRLTIPNVLLNAPRTEDDDGDQGLPECRFFSGDWGALNQLLPERHYDLILTSETIYNLNDQQKLLSLLSRCLSDAGSVLLAAKVHYFGVGGGLAQFVTVADESGWEAKTVDKIESGVKREVIELKRKPADHGKKRSHEGESGE